MDAQLPQTGPYARQQSTVVELGARALAGLDLGALMDQTVVAVAEALDVEFSKVLELLPDGESFLLRAGVGWNEGLVRQTTVGAGLLSQAGYTMARKEPVVVEDSDTETRFAVHQILRDHGVVSGISVGIGSVEHPFGVLGAHTAERRTFTEQDISFVQAVANVLAAAIERWRGEEALRDSERRLRSTLDGMLEGCQIIGFDWRYMYVNDIVAEYGRRTKEELLGHTMMEMYPGIDGTEMFGHLRRCMEQRVPHRMENEFTYLDGAKGWFELSIQPVPEGILILSLDITDRARAEEELRGAREALEERVERRLERGAAYGLTFRETTVLHLVAAGKSDKEIAVELCISPLTAHKHLSNILSKMRAASRTEAGVRAVREGLLG